MTDNCTGFYSSYADYKGDRTPQTGRKGIARFEAEAGPFDRVIHRFLSWALFTPPPLWSANFYGMLVSR